MDNSKYISFNGKIFTEDEFKLDLNNRAFLYGDGLFETMHAAGGKVHFFYDHIDRLIRSMKILKMEVPVRFSIDTLGIQKEIFKLLNKNKFHIAAKIRITVFRKSGGLYTPTNNEVDYLIQTEKLETAEYQLNSNGLIIDIFEDIPKPNNKLSNLKITSSIYFVIAGIYKSEKKLDDCIVLNEKGNMVEAISSNLFLVKENNIYTPPLSSGCLNGIIRNKIIDISKTLNFNIIDNTPLNSKDLISADEVFLTNAVSGIKWVLAFKQRRYYNKISKILIAKLNQTAFQ
ncbi:MAG: aminotransferase class IV [Bacteroidales bacterium]|nr:aminotransferase class IV [Bacteroidales bacterium]